MYVIPPDSPSDVSSPRLRTPLLFGMRVGPPSPDSPQALPQATKPRAARPPHSRTPNSNSWGSSLSGILACPEKALLVERRTFFDRNCDRRRPVMSSPESTRSLWSRFNFQHPFALLHTQNSISQRKETSLALTRTLSRAGTRLHSTTSPARTTTPRLRPT